MLVLHALRIELGKSYRGTIDLLSEMPGILEETGLTKLPHFTVLRTWFGRIPMKTWRAFLGRSAEKRTGHAAIDATVSTVINRADTTPTVPPTVFVR